MDKYVRAEAAKGAIGRVCFGLVLDEETEKALTDAIDEIPAVDVVEVKHGKWIEHEDKLGMTDDLMCSLCGHCTYQDYPNFCSNCGADMRGGDNYV